MTKRGRRSNWDGIIAFVGRRTWKALRAAGMHDYDFEPGYPAILRLGRAAIEASAEAAKAKNKRFDAGDCGRVLKKAARCVGTRSGT
jgi:hypothetical protein